MTDSTLPILIADDCLDIFACSQSSLIFYMPTSFTSSEGTTCIVYLQRTLKSFLTTFLTE